MKPNCPYSVRAAFLAMLAAAGVARGGAVLTTIHAFGANASGSGPQAGLTRGTDNNFYGTTSAGGINGAGTVFKITPDGALTSLWSFTGGIDGGDPVAGLALGRDGNFYGTTVKGGASGEGAIFKITPAGALKNLYSFTGGSDGASPAAGLVLGVDGNFYGTTSSGGSNGMGTVFEITSIGILTSLYSFTNGADGGEPLAGLAQGDDGNFYGTTFEGGNITLNGGLGFGTVFEITPGGELTSLYCFTNGVDGGNPVAALALGDDGNFYGLAQSGGDTNLNGGEGFGAVFKITPEGALTPLYSFTDGDDGGFPLAGLVSGGDGNFYGTTQTGGTNFDGTAFSITPSGNLTSLYSFTGHLDGDGPECVLALGSDGNFYGTTSGGFDGSGGAVFKMTPAGALTPLYSFTYDIEGANPAAGLALGGDGNFYGTAEYGGTNGDGAVFKITPAGALTPLWSFDGADGLEPTSALALGADGNFYGTAQGGGVGGYGTAFQITPAGGLTRLWSFGTGLEGVFPVGGLARGNDTNFYGTTLRGGTNGGRGAVFKIAPTGVLTSLWSFGGPDGEYPQAALALGRDGNLYGTTAYGGSNGFGTVFSITPAGILTSLYSFTNGGDGSEPVAGLATGQEGNFYGTTEHGGTNGNGTVFKITPAGVLTSLHSFTGGLDGANPLAGLALGADTNFYGTTDYGGAEGGGTVFKITPAGLLTPLYSFTGGTDGANPAAGMTLGGDGNFYGTTAYGGAGGNGTVFRLVLTPAEQSAFNAITVTGGMVNLVWSAVAGGIYQVQVNPDLTAAHWANFGGTVTATGTTATVADSLTSSQRFYRVVLLNP